MNTRQSKKVKPLVMKTAELAMAVPQVVAHRVARMALAGKQPSQRDQHEFKKMTDEKGDAFRESWAAMAVQAVRSNQALASTMFRTFWASALTGKVSTRNATAVANQFQNAALDIMSKGFAPVHQRAVANSKRLAKTRLM
jgi:hypothetical protein